MIELVFATSNPNKVKEVRELLPHLKILSLSDLNWTEDIEETEDTLEGNALLKARVVADALEINCFSEDTGLEVPALEGRPGVHSARYAGPQRDAGANMEKLLQDLDGIAERDAQFRTVMALILDGATFCFHGVVKGRIGHEPKGTHGFGYDPIFIPEGHDASFGELTSEVKKDISHRARAMRKLIAFLEQYLRCRNPK